MDLSNIAQTLLDKHARRTQHLRGLTGATARDHYKQGVADLLNAIQHAAVDEELQQSLSAPSAVQAGHASVDNPLGVPK